MFCYFFNLFFSFFFVILVCVSLYWKTLLRQGPFPGFSTWGPFLPSIYHCLILQFDHLLICFFFFFCLMIRSHVDVWCGLSWLLGRVTDYLTIKILFHCAVLLRDILRLVVKMSLYYNRHNYTKKICNMRSWLKCCK